ncbi:MAG: hypothetical protein ACUZ8E_06975 [Candidatus Anammoxibacter sp.]
MKTTEIMKDKKYLHYALQISAAIGQLLDEDEESDYHIDKDELMQDDNLTHFIHALANVAPSVIYNKLTGDNKNHLEFNHVANKLCFQYSKKD